MKAIKNEPLHIAQPYSKAAEQAVIGALLFAPMETFAVVDGKLLPRHFYDEFCRAVFECAVGFLANGNVPDVVVISAALEGAIELSQEEIHNQITQICLNHPNINNVGSWVELVLRKSADRDLEEAGITLQDLAHAQNISSEEKLNRAGAALTAASSALAKDTFIPLAEALTMTLAVVEQNCLSGGGVTGLSTGYKELDELTAGLQKNTFIILAARPSMGKTSLALCFAHAVAAHPEIDFREPVVLFNMEMKAVSMGMRWLGVDKKIPLSHLLSGRVSEAEHARCQEALREAPDVPFFIEDTAMQTVEQLAAKARKLKREKGLSLLIIDYLQLIVGSDPRASRQQQISDISRALKNLSGELGIPIIALSQLSRDLEKRQDKRPIMSDLRESGAIEQDADMIVFVYRDEVYNPNTHERGVAEIIIAKQRNGALGTVKLTFDGPTTCFLDRARTFIGNNKKMNTSTSAEEVATH